MAFTKEEEKRINELLDKAFNRALEKATSCPGCNLRADIIAKLKRERDNLLGERKAQSLLMLEKEKELECFKEGIEAYEKREKGL